MAVDVTVVVVEAVTLGVRLDVVDGAIVGVGVDVRKDIGVAVAVNMAADSGLLVSVAPPVSGMINSGLSTIRSGVGIRMIGIANAAMPITKSVIKIT